MTREQVILELNEARRIWGSRSLASPDRLLVIIKGLGFILVKCPKDMVSMVQAHILEAESRLAYLEVGI